MQNNEQQLEGRDEQRADTGDKKNNRCLLEENMSEVTNSVENHKQQVQSLEEELQDRNRQLEDLRAQLLREERELERNKHWEEGSRKHHPGHTHTHTHTSTETQHSESRQGEVAGRRVTVVDTPDWFCSGLSEKDMRQDVGLCVHLSAPGPHAFLLLIPVEPSEGEERRMLEKMEDIFGEGCWGHTLILFTHAEGLRERSVEELLQTGSQELQQLVEKCGNRCHLLNIKDRPDDTKITQLLEKIEEMVSRNRERFYSTETYQEAERQLREIERRMQKEREVEERKL
ncbi:GTPase IMAP family member 3-like, partial [Alosa alosa]|uniref:GTPase IMAP family member 3-like n=1 Tax=Alosa alosa TaxID=278164 RepID=UPI0020151AD7